METPAHLTQHRSHTKTWTTLICMAWMMALPIGARAQSYPASLQNTATGTVPTEVTDPAPGNNTATDTNTLAAQAALTITKTLASASPAPAGSVVRYRIEVANAGPSTAVGAALTDTLPPQLTATSWTCVASAGSACSAASGSGNIAITLTLLSGGSAVIETSGTAPLVAPTAIGANTATITPPPGVTDPDPGDNTSTTPPVPVTARAIVAVDDTAGPIDGGPGQSAIVNVLANDTLDGAPVIPAQVVLTPANAGPLVIQPNGNVDVAAGTPTGVYTASYTLCEAANPGNCDGAQVTVTVNAAATIDAIDDAFAPRFAGTVGALGNVLANDTLAGGPVGAQVVLTSAGGGPLTIAADGTATLDPAAAPGVYSATYQICEQGFPANCDSATATVRAFPPIDAADDVAGPINGAIGSPSVVNVLANDTAGGASPPSLTVVALTPANTPQIVINPDGTVSVPPGTPAGTHTASYTLCYVDAPALCDGAAVQITVATPGALVATDDTFAGIDGTAGNPAVGNVRDNDTLAGGPATPALVSITPVTTGPISIGADGVVSIAPNTPAGTYTATYEACEIALPDNCDTAIVSVGVSSIAAQLDGFAATPPGAVAGNVLDNDFVNGAPATPAQVTLTQLAGTPALMIGADGNATVAANTPSGPITGRYRICLVAAPAICSEADVSLTVSAGNVIAVDDVLGPANGSSGGVVPGNVLDNDTFNGAPIVPGQVTITPANAGPITIGTDGSVTLAPNTPAGAYVAGYTLCEAINPANCDSAQITVQVSTLAANDDALGPINGAIGGNAGNVLSNDALDGAPPGPVDVILTPNNAGPIVIGIDGSVTITPGTPPGTYTAGYTICSQATPAICDSASVSVSVVAIAALDAVSDVFGPVDGAAGNANIGNVLANDTIDGLPIVPGTVTLTPTVAAPLVVAADGTVSIAPGTPAGVYNGSYQICEIARPDNCDFAGLTVTVRVTAVIVAADDGPFIVDGAGGAAGIANLLANDTYNGAAITPGTVTLIHTAAAPFTVAPDGTLSVAANATPGTFTFDYTICDAADPPTCDTATVSVRIVVADAIDDAFTVTSGPGGVAGNVLANDTLDGAAPSAADVTITGTFAAPLSLAPDGSVIVAPNAPAGTYTGTYTICVIAAPAICDSAAVSVVVGLTAIDAVDDALGPINGASGGVAGNVLANDTLAGAAAVAGTVTVSTTATAPISIAADGTVTVAPGAAAGTYTATYTLCEAANPGNCDSAQAVVTVTTLDAVDDALGPIDGTAGGSAGNVLANDTLDGTPVVPGTVTLAPTTAGPLSIAGDGTVTVAPNTPAGSYTATYQICQVAQPAICDGASVTVAVTVTAALDAVDDAFGPIDGADGSANAGNVLANDRINGTPIPPGVIVLTSNATAPLTIAADGTVSIAAGVSAGQYTATYQICETAAPTNCDTATVVVTISPPPVDAIDDMSQPVPGGLPMDNVLNVLENDWYNGGDVDMNEVVLTPTTSGPLTLQADGTIDLAAGTPGGTYVLSYQVCDALNPTNCDTATATVMVMATALAAADDAAQTEQDTAITIATLSNDLYAGTAADPERVQVAITTAPASGTAVVDAQGRVVYTPGQYFSGQDTFQYQLCERSAPTNCVLANVTVTVLQNTITSTDDAAIAQAGPVTIDVLANDSSTHAPLDPASLVIAVAPQFGTATCAQGTCTYTPQEDYVGEDRFTYRICDVSVPTPVCAQAVVVVEVQAAPATLRLSKTAAQRSIRVDDLVRYTLRIENVGEVDAVQVELFDAVPAGFSYVPNSLQVADADGTGAVISAYPLRIGALDIAIGQSATLSYVLRAGAGVGPGVHTNRATMRDADGDALSNEATADVEVVGDPLLDDSLIIGTVFHDANGNGRQDSGERGLPGVRLGTVEGLLVETDRYGRFHLVGIDGGKWARGRNFLMKVDAATLPPGSRFTTENPRVQRITPGVPVRFDFGVQVPGMPLGGGTGEVTIELGQVLFAHDSAEIPAEHAPMFDQMATRLRESGGGSVTITANAGDFVLAFQRASATRDALDARLSPDVRQATRIELLAQVGDVTALVTMDKDIALGNLLFDTDSTRIRPQYAALIEALAQRIEQGGEMVVSIIGHADARGPDQHNQQLSRRRAEAVAEALKVRLTPERRARLQVVPRDTRVTHLDTR